jgi:hypothetical protein
MALKEMDENGQWRNLTDLKYRQEFDDIWRRFSPKEQRAIIEEVHRRLDWAIGREGIINISIEAGQDNGIWPYPFLTIYEHLGDVDAAALFYDKIWELQIIERPEKWIYIRPDPAFTREIRLGTYFLAKE